MAAFVRDLRAASDHDVLGFLHALMSAINTHMTFDEDPTNTGTSAVEAFTLKRGVCQDYAHIFTACARSGGVPARFVAGHFWRADVATGKESMIPFTADVDLMIAGPAKETYPVNDTSLLVHQIRDVAPSPDNKRLAFLEKVTREGSTDPMAWYGLAMEYRKLERWDEALQTFSALRASHPDYVAMYLMCGQMLAEASRTDEAREWLDTGLGAARAKGDSHAVSEIESALSTL